VSLFFRGERRDFGQPPIIPPNSERGMYSMRRVDLSTAESAMQKIAISASVNMLASLPAMLPLDVYTGQGAQKREIPKPKWLLDLGGDGHGTEDWSWQAIYSWGLRGNLTGLIDARDPITGKPRQIVMQHPDDVTVRRLADGTPEWRINGKIIASERIFHRRIYPVPGCIQGASPVAQHILTIGAGIAAEQFGAQFFLDGGHPTALFQNTEKTIDADAARTIKQRVMAVMRGNREPLVVGKDWTYKAIQIAPNESQFLQTNEYSNAECARIYGPGMPEMLGYQTGGTLTYANQEQRSIDLLKYTINPWLNRLERLYTELLPNPQYAKFNRAALLETDILTRFQVHDLAIRNQLETVNEIRSIEDLPPVEWGDGRPSSTKPVTPAEVIRWSTPGVAAGVLTTDEVRELANEAGAQLVLPGPDVPPVPAPSNGAP
jgi:HK97 family phage portal protein